MNRQRRNVNGPRCDVSFNVGVMCLGHVMTCRSQVATSVANCEFHPLSHCDIFDAFLLCFDPVLASDLPYIKI